MALDAVANGLVAQGVKQGQLVCLDDSPTAIVFTEKEVEQESHAWQEGDEEYPEKGDVGFSVF